MDFALTEEQLQFQREFKKFVEREIAPFAERVDQSSELCWDNVRKLGEYGYIGLHFPERYGGVGGDVLTSTLAAEILGGACASTSLSVGASMTLVALPILLFGTEEQKMRYLPRLLSGKMVGAFGLTEPNAGSDVASIRTQALPYGDEYVIDGTKMFITNGPAAEVALITAVTNANCGTKGFSQFLVERGTPGFSAGGKLQKIGVRGSPTSELVLADCHVSKDRLLGIEGQGFAQVMATLEYGRVGISALAVGIAQAAFDASLKYAKERTQFGRVIADNQAMQRILANMRYKIEAARWLLYRVAWLKDQGRRCAVEASMAKLAATDAGAYCTTEAMHIHGGYGLMEEYKVERLLRDFRVCEVGEGTREVQELFVIARNLLLMQ